MTRCVCVCMYVCMSVCIRTYRREQLCDLEEDDNDEAILEVAKGNGPVDALVCAYMYIYIIYIYIYIYIYICIYKAFSFPLSLYIYIYIRRAGGCCPCFLFFLKSLNIVALIEPTP